MSEKKWTRPESVPVPTVWRRFEGKRKAPDGSTLTFRVQDITPDMYDAVIELMEKNFVRDELLNQCVRLEDDQESVEFLRTFWRTVLDEKLGLVALLEGDVPKVVGANILSLVHKGSKASYEQFQGQAMRKLFKLLIDHVNCEVDPFAIYDVDVYMSALGLSVDPVYRGQGLGLELLKARFDLGRALGIPVTVTSFTGLASQTLAHKLDFEILAEISYSDYKDNGVAIFQNDSCKSLKVMGKLIN